MTNRIAVVFGTAVGAVGETGSGSGDIALQAVTAPWSSRGSSPDVPSWTFSVSDLSVSSQLGVGPRPNAESNNVEAPPVPALPSLLDDGVRKSTPPKRGGEDGVVAAASGSDGGTAAIFLETAPAPAPAPAPTPANRPPVVGQRRHLAADATAAPPSSPSPAGDVLRGDAIGVTAKFGCSSSMTVALGDRTLKSLSSPV
eukprot:CAMPEP_0183299226 /NCGR_PEP_ID=MMETSP0160_2-20130417/6013_1 /TAXON_ID=2839 ORGANISM="Odontella Sinensis, Strain Grunow 1884" /NCGR_SAMPLE_ID=MMETSP0160_2 /ASSEMBLY_ACC=CAM_ASM_000250 /LENGTH=198 /DNA_ID=CAMNT_0025461427 /DNA_START=179 /DNA_END=773 /DNA_ORIENTATION=+